MATPLTSHLDRLRPVICRMVARDGKHSRTVATIAKLSGLSIREVIRLTKLTSWASVRVATVDKFMAACGVDPVNQVKTLRYIRRQMISENKFPHIKLKNRQKYFSQQIGK